MSVIPASISPLSSPPSTISERRCLYYFQLATQNDISRFFGTSFWDSLVLPAANIYPTVRHSLLAVSTLYEAYFKKEYESHRSQGVLDTPTSQSALVEYNKAVGVLSSVLLGSSLPREIVLICCLLFVWLEFLRNDLATGLKHLKSGILIIKDAHQSKVPSPLSAANHVNESVAHLFTRLQIQATLHGCPQSDFNMAPLDCPTEVNINAMTPQFETAETFRHSLDRKLVQVFQFVRKKQNFERSRGSEAAVVSSEWSHLIAERDMHLVDLEQWHAAFEESLISALSNKKNVPGVLLIGLNHAMAVLMMKNLFFETEMLYDYCIDDFSHLLGLAENILQQSPPRGSSPTLSLDMGVIPVLFYVVMKCRNVELRHKAMELLRCAPDREGIWHRDTIIAAGAWKVAMEEKQLSMELGVDALPETARIYREQVTDADKDGEQATVRFEGGPAGSGGMSWEIRGLLSRLGDMM